MRTPLAVLNDIQIASPCTADWARMTGDDRVRHCAQCDKDVFDLSQLTAEAAVQLIETKQGHVCVRLYRRADGTVLTEDCPTGWRQRAGRAARRMLALATSWLSVIGLSGCGRQQMGAPLPLPLSTKATAAPTCVMGEVACEPLERAPMPREEFNASEQLPL